MIFPVIKFADIERLSTYIRFKSWIIYKGFKAICSKPNTFPLRAPLIHIGIDKAAAITSHKERRPSMKLSFEHKTNSIKRVDVIRVFAFSII
jgi:hypothetical protein